MRARSCCRQIVQLGLDQGSHGLLFSLGMRGTSSPPFSRGLASHESVPLAVLVVGLLYQSVAAEGVWCEGSLPSLVEDESKGDESCG
jgi:hypothetical protein